MPFFQGETPPLPSRRRRIPTPQRGLPYQVCLRSLLRKCHVGHCTEHCAVNSVVNSLHSRTPWRRRPPCKVLADHRLRWKSLSADEVHWVLTTKLQQRLPSEVHPVNRTEFRVPSCSPPLASPAHGLSRRGLLTQWTLSQGWHLQNASIHLGTETRTHQMAYSMSCGMTLGVVEVRTLDLLDLFHTVRSASSAKPMSVTSVLEGGERSFRQSYGSPPESHLFKLVVVIMSP